MDRDRPQPLHIRPAQVAASLRDGMRMFGRTRGLSLSFAGVFALVGSAMLVAAMRLGFGPMILPLTGGFMLVAPALLAGFFAIARAQRAGGPPRWRDVAAGVRNISRSLWGLLLVCGLLFVIWITDAGILYSFMVGARAPHTSLLFPLSGVVLRFGFGAAVAGAFLATIVFCVTAYAVPLLIDRRADLVVAVSASVRAVFRSVAANLTWAFVLAASVMVAVVVPLLLAVVLPVMGYATESLYRAVFPPDDPGDC